MDFGREGAKREARMLIGQHRFRAFVEVHAAPIDPVAAGAGKRIGNRKPAVVRAGKPAKGALGVGKPDRDRKSVVRGKRVSVRVDLGGRRSIKKKKKQTY